MKVNFVSNTPLHQGSGGVSGMSIAAWEVLRRHHQATYIGPINPSPFLNQHIRSKCQALFGVGREFFFFSEARLDRIKRQTERLLTKHPADLDFFHGFTPWIHVRTSRPYVTWNDCTFSQYMDVFHDRLKFSKESLSRIIEKEIAWLQRANAVWFRSRYAAECAIREYGLRSDHVFVVGNYGRVAPPERDRYAGGKDLLFVSTDFEKKGGALVVAAVERVLPDHPGVKLVIIGDRPSAQIRRKCFVRYVGFLRKEVPSELKELRRWLGTARVLVHPTRADTNPMVIIEAGYQGCPCIASSVFAIPEIVRDQRTGVLLRDSMSVEEIATSISHLLNDEGRYATMRDEVWRWTRTEYSRERFELRFSELLAALPGMGC